MLKRNIFILAAGMLLSAQVAVAVDQSAAPQSAAPQSVFPRDYEIPETLPAQLKWLDEHPPVHISNPMDDVFPTSAEDESGEPLPAQLKWLDEHPPVHTPSPRDADVFPIDYGGE